MFISPDGLTDIVFFYHWRAVMDNDMCASMSNGMMNCDMMAMMFPPPEVDENRPTIATSSRALGIFPMPQVANIVAFLKTLSDGYVK